MTEPTASRPVPGPYRPAPVPQPVPARDPAPADSAPEAGESTAAADSAPVDPAPADPTPADPAAPPTQDTAAGPRLADLDGLPVAEHVAVFETEHARLQRELGTIDRL